ncbi:hypothetical protein L208DRAFT_1271735, partial [Tricholoma matsutake]
HWTIPHSIWKEMKESWREKKLGPKQRTLNFIKEGAPCLFTCKNLLHAVTQFIAVDDQSLAVVNKTTFQNCLVTMRPRTISPELPMTHDVLNHLHNEFV